MNDLQLSATTSAAEPWTTWLRNRDELIAALGDERQRLVVHLAHIEDAARTLHDHHRPVTTEDGGPAPLVLVDRAQLAALLALVNSDERTMR